jgi:glycosyltransferase involved in cell wall biosynthesis
LVRRWRCDIIHVHNFSQFVPFVRAFNPKAFVALHMNCEWLSQHSHRMVEKRIEKTDAVLCCSGHIRRCLLDAFPAMHGKSNVVFNGVNVDRFVPSRGPATDGKGDLRVLFVGRISPEKGVHLLVDAFAALAARFPNVYLDLVGGAGSLPAEFLVSLSRDPLVRGLEKFYKTDYLTEVKRRIPAELHDRILFHGNVVHEELARIYGKAAVFVAPSLSDAFPLTVVEAMAAGLPVVASRVGGIPEAVVEDETGLLVEPDNADALAATLSRVLMDSEMRRRMSAGARNRAAELYSWRAISQQVALAYSGTVQVGVDTHADYASADTAN